MFFCLVHRNVFDILHHRYVYFFVDRQDIGHDICPIISGWCTVTFSSSVVRRLPFLLKCGTSSLDWAVLCPTEEEEASDLPSPGLWRKMFVHWVKNWGQASWSGSGRDSGLSWSGSWLTRKTSTSENWKPSKFCPVQELTVQEESKKTGILA